MYNDQLEPRIISIDDIFLDPNNPRFWNEQTQKVADVPDTKVPDDTHQSKTRARIGNHGLEELKNSILRNGFLPLDRIVVRELKGVPGKYVVIEGNRRLAALKLLREQIDDQTIQEEGIDEDKLKSLKESTDKIEVLVYDGSDTKNIAWLLQGIRHIGGIRNWAAAQQGKLVADQIDKEGLSLSEAGQHFGLSAQAVGRRYRSYKALEQMREDEEFGSKAKNEYYSLFEEAIREKNVKKWLEWDDGEKRFKNTDSLKQFYSWICPDEEHPTQDRRLHDPRHISSLGRILATNQDALMAKIEKHEIGIEAAEQKLNDDFSRYDWNAAFEQVKTLLGDIPNSAIDKDAVEIIAALTLLEEQIVNLRKKAAAVVTQQGQVVPPPSAPQATQI